MAEAEQEKLRKEGAGRAAAVEAEGRAEAAKIEAIGLAQAKAIEAQGVAEAAAILRKAEAWKQFNDAARLQTILEKLPAILEASSGIFGAVAAPLGNIDKLVVIDQGTGNGDNGSSSLGRLAKTSPAVVFNLLQQLEALGLNVPSVLQQLGLAPPSTAPAPITPVVEVQSAPPSRKPASWTRRSSRAGASARIRARASRISVTMTLFSSDDSAFGLRLPRATAIRCAIESRSSAARGSGVTVCSGSFGIATRRPLPPVAIA